MKGGLYCIADSLFSDRCGIFDQVAAMIRGGAQLIQYRDKDASDEDFYYTAGKIRSMTRDAGVSFIVNDRVLIAREVDADGVHLGQEDMSLEEVRGILSTSAMVGRSTHSLEQSLQAEKEGVSYISIGSVFPTNTKPDYLPVGLGILRQVVQKVKISVVAIGGIHQENLLEVLEMGVRRVAMISEILSSSDIEDSVRSLTRIIYEYSQRN